MSSSFRLFFPLLLLFFLAATHSGAQNVNPEYLRTIPIRSIGPGAMSGRITAIAVDPERPEVIYAGAASGGVWRSKSGGTAWEPIFDAAPTQSIGAITVNPRNPDEIWVGTGEGNPRNSQNFGIGIFKSRDGGKNWLNMGLEKTHAIYRIVLHRDNPDVIFAAAMGSAFGPNEDRGVFKSADGGKTWRKVLYVNDLTGCADLVADPANPNKLYAAMWEYQRWPWFFKSGGKGSGLYVSLDAGETWERRGSDDGLPEGELGRIGLAVAPSKPNIVYALVEAKDNALFKSTDGGKKWQKMADKGMGDRPFYYSEIYVNPKNEYMVYSVHSQITRSVDGGKSFENWVGFWDIHPDHHAFWIHPDDPDYIIEGNDGGLNITHDGGRTWRYAENIPVGQFYHLNVDNERPYNIYGGLQDNGTWIGPSSAWKNGGMRNSDWQEILFGDGFDAMPQKDNTRYAFGMSQGGELTYVDRKTGDSRYIKPLHPGGTELRFNWNAGLAQDPFHDHGLFFGSQFLHYSSDLGQNWEIISPDLTSNDTSKLHQDRSGGLTLDATNAENYCTIIAIAPSPAQRGVVWVGTDDGRAAHQDGGKTWDDLADRMPDFPKNGWIPQIEVSAKNAGEAFVVVNNYRQNDWQPYLYHTTDFGKKWHRLANAKNVTGFCLSVVQDPEVPNLLFLGTDQGLYLSIDYGHTWTHLPQNPDGGFPSVPVQDMKIQARDADLVIATFGRGIWIVDDIRPIRDLARSSGALLDQPFKVFPPQDAVLAAWRSFDGERFGANAIYAGDNKGTAARITVWVKPGEVAASKEKKKKKDKEEADKKDKPADKKGQPAGKPKPDKATVLIQSMAGDTLRRFKSELDTCFNYIYWNLDTRGIRFPSNNEPGPDQLEPGGGPSVLPGAYKVTILWGDYRDSTVVNVLDDTRLDITPAQRQAQADATRDLYKTVDKAAKAYDRLKEAEKTLRMVEDQFANVPDSTKKETLKLGKTLRDSIGALKEAFFNQKEGKGIQRNPENLNARFWKAFSYLQPGPVVPNASAQIAMTEAKNETDKLIARINALFDGPWKDFRAKAEQIRYTLFKDYQRL